MTKLSVVHQLQDRIDVAHFLELQFQDLADLRPDEWDDTRRYAIQGGLKI